MGTMDEKKYYLDFGPELIKLLGPNMYTNIYYVLGEIIANAYDADATNVYIVYNNQTKKIIVEDDGCGMSYDDFNEKYLHIGEPTRVSDEMDVTPKFKRKRMGRKGIGKLSALSVSDKVMVMSVKNGVKSGCVLSLDIKKESDGKWSTPGLAEDDIHFEFIDENKSGSSIVMVNVKHSVNKTIDSAKRNISKLFPFISRDFKIHLYDENTNEHTTIDNNISTIVQLSDALITFADQDSSEELDCQLIDCHKAFDNDRYYKDVKEPIEKKELHINKSPIRKTLRLTNNDGEEKEYVLEIKGWIATYASLPKRKSENDFPINYISIISHGKLGRIDIIPEISTNRTYETYVVGQFFIDLLEDSSLPDISASNRQGYKEDDLRYRESLDLIRNCALKPIINLKDSATKVKHHNMEEKKKQKTKKTKKKMDAAINDLLDNPVLSKAIAEDKDNQLKKQLENVWEIKNTVNESYKKVMISHCSKDEELTNELEEILLFCGFTSDEILYTSSTHPESRPEPYGDLYEYLRTFFIDTTKRNNLCVIYIINKQFIRKWNPVLEAGAGWVVKSEAFPFFTDSYGSIKEPIRKNNQMIPKLALDMSQTEVQNLTNGIIKICKKCEKEPPEYNKLLHFIMSTKLYKD